jgi:hypothetical protein
VAELSPFALWAMTGGQFPLAIGVLQVLALDIGTDMLPALALGTEPPRSRIMQGRRARSVVDRNLLLRSFCVLGAGSRNRLVLVAVGAELILLIVFLGWPALAELL